MRRYSRLGPIWMDDGGLDGRALVAMLDLLHQSFVESQKRRLGAAVVNGARQGNEGSKTCDTHDVAFFLSEHVWQKLLDGTPVTQKVDVEHLVQILFWDILDGPRVTNAGVVDKDSW